MARVLHIDDEEASRRLVKKILEAAGHEVAAAGSGVEGIRMATEKRPDIILLDIQLPDMDGYEVTLRLKTESGEPRAPIVAVTGAGDREMSLAVGCDGYIPKPIDVTRFASAVEGYLRGGRSERPAGSPELLRFQGRRMASRLQEKIEELEETNRRLVESEKARTEFYRNLSHELSTPLTPALGYLNMLLAEELGPLSPLQRKAVESIHRSFGRVRSVLENLLDMTAISTGKMVFFAHRYDFNEIARESLERCRPVLAEKLIAVESAIADDPFRGYGDSDKLKRAMVQLIENAAKFCSSGGRVRVETRRGSGRFGFLVYDSGQGIPRDALAAIFETGYQVDGSTTREHGGAGLGLALARRIAERFGGEVWAESPPREESRPPSWARTLVALRVPEVMAGENPPAPSI